MLWPLFLSHFQLSKEPTLISKMENIFQKKIWPKDSFKFFHLIRKEAHWWFCFSAIGVLWGCFLCRRETDTIGVRWPIFGKKNVFYVFILWNLFFEFFKIHSRLLPTIGLNPGINQRWLFQHMFYVAIWIYVPSSL